MINKTLKELTRLLREACSVGDLDKVKYFLTSKELPYPANINIDEHEWDAPLTRACENGHLHIVKYLLTSKDLKEHADINGEDGLALVNACMHGHFEIVKYLLSSPELIEHADINICDSLPIINAAYTGNLEIVKYLLTSPDLEEHARTNFYMPSESALVKAAGGNHLEMVDFILTCKDIKDKPNSESIEYAFKVAVNNSHFNIVEYFIFDFNIEKNESIQKNLNTCYDKKILDQVNFFFTKRELNQALNIDLKTNLDTKKQIKL